MIHITRTRTLAVGLALMVIAAGAGWAMYFLERQRSMRLALQLADTEPDVAALRRYQYQVNELRAIREMLSIRNAYQVYYLRMDRWPNHVQEVVPFLEGGLAAILDPWGNAYSAVIESDGKDGPRVVVSCQPPGDNPPLRYPK